MKRLFFWFAAGLALFILFFFGFNLFDSGARSGDGTHGPAPLPENLEPGNGFFIVWGFAEAPETDVGSPAYHRRMRELLARSPRVLSVRSPYGQWLARLNAGFRQNWPGTNFFFPQSPREDLAAYFDARRSPIAGQRGLFDPLLRRYRQVLESAALADFTPLNRECPGRSLLLASQAAKYFAAMQLLAALDNGWPAAAGELLRASDAGFRLIASGRTLAVNALGKSMVELTLRALASLLNRPECPQEFARFVLDRMPDRPAGQFGTKAVRSFHFLNFQAAVGRIKRDKVVEPFLLKDFFRDPAAFYAMERFIAISGPRIFMAAHALAAFFLKESETAGLLREYWAGIDRLEAIPPWRWEKDAPAPAPATPARNVSGPLWWMRNPLGKMLVRAAVPFQWPIRQHYVNRSYELKARYDLLRLLARARLARGAGAGLAATELRRLLAEGARDPFSGAPYRFARAPGALYSVGADAVDNQGRERQEIWRDSDIAVPIRFVSGD